MNNLEKILKIRWILGCDENQVIAFIDTQGVSETTALLWAQQGALTIRDSEIVKLWCHACSNSGFVWVPEFEQIGTQRRAYCNCEKGRLMQGLIGDL